MLRAWNDYFFSGLPLLLRFAIALNRPHLMNMTLTVWIDAGALQMVVQKEAFRNVFLRDTTQLWNLHTKNFMVMKEVKVYTGHTSIFIVY